MTTGALESVGYTGTHRFLKVCRGCARLWESEIGDRGKPPTQQCTCGGPPAKWPGWDVSEWARLCDCCLGEVLPSGSRWSVWFCNDCRDRVVALNHRVGAPLIPIGRHTLMNGVFFKPTEDPVVDEPNLEEFTGSMLGLFDRIRRLGDWKEQRLSLVLDTLGLPDGVPLADHLAAWLAADDPRLRKESAFIALAGFFGIPAERL